MHRHIATAAPKTRRCETEHQSDGHQHWLQYHFRPLDAAQIWHTCPLKWPLPVLTSQKLQLLPPLWNQLHCSYLDSSPLRAFSRTNSLFSRERLNAHALFFTTHYVLRGAAPTSFTSELLCFMLSNLFLILISRKDQDAASMGPHRLNKEYGQ